MNSSKPYEDDNISYCSSGETFSSRRRRLRTVKQHSIDDVAQKLKLEGLQNKQQAYIEQETPLKRRFNNSFHSLRFVVVMMGGVSYGAMIILRYNITVAILSMVNQTAIYLEENPTKTVDDFLAEGHSLGGEFTWNNEVQHMIMSSYMIAYTLPQIPATKLGIFIGNRWATPISLAICALATIATPTFAYMGWKYVVFLRMLDGLGASNVISMMLHMVEHWMPYSEISIGLTCAQILQATLISANPLISGYLSSYHWSYAFYVPASVTLVFCVIWILVVTDKPETNRFISQKELDYIFREDQLESDDQKDPNQKEKQVEEVAAKSKVTQVFRIPSFYAYIVIWCFYCSSYTCFSFISPRYLRQFLKISVANTGLYCTMIQSGCILATLWPVPLIRFCENKLKFSVDNSRRVAYLIVCCMTAGSWIYVGLFHQSQLFFLFLNRCFHGSNDIVVTGSMMSNYSKLGLSSLVFSMVNTVGNLSIVFSSPLIGYILDLEAQSVASWTWILIALGSSQLIMLLTYVVMIRTEPITFEKKNNDPKKSNTIAAFTKVNVTNNNQLATNNLKTQEALDIV